MNTKADYNKIHILRYFYKYYTTKVDVKIIRQVLNVVNQTIIDKLLEGELVRLPYNLGDLYITRNKPKVVFDDNGRVDLAQSHIPINWHETKNLWATMSKEEVEKTKPLVFFENIHSGGYTMKVKWVNKLAIKQTKLYRFKPSRYLTRSLNKHIINTGKIDYYDN